MSLQFVHGVRSNAELSHLLQQTLVRAGTLSGTLWFGYPVVPAEDGHRRADALLVSTEQGIVLFWLPSIDQPLPRCGQEWQALAEDLDEIYSAIAAKLTQNPDLLKRRKLAVPIHTVVFSTSVERRDPPDELAETVRVADESDLVGVLASLPGLEDPTLVKPLNATIERVRTIKPRERRAHVQRQDSRGAVLRKIEKEIANLDAHQKRGAVECPEGPQRIRGLAGSGKTIVLALKAAYLHAEHPDWSIAIVFYTRFLNQQLEDLIRRFFFDQAQDEPDWSKVQVLPAWGSDRFPGFYSSIARDSGNVPLSWNEARQAFGSGGQAFEGACQRLAEALREAPGALRPRYDAVLIDEAQDLPQPFFELAWAGSRPPHRVVWAYDELQNLGDYTMTSPDKLFGVDTNGAPRARLENREDRPHQDVVLPKCYRNTPWALTVAHALGLGVYRKEGLVQWVEQTRLWEAIGYEVVSGNLRPGDHAILRRRSDSTPEFFEQLLDAQDAVAWKAFKSDEQQLSAVVAAIEGHLAQDELLPSDILVIFPDPITHKSRGARLQVRLREAGIASHIVGVTSSVHGFTMKDSVTISSIYRAKGNEAAMVYVLDSHWAALEPELERKRNILFTAITRSRAWVRISGVGPGMHAIGREISQVIQSGFELRIKIPGPPELRKLRRLHRDLGDAERQQTSRLAVALNKALDPEDDALVKEVLRQLPDAKRRQLRWLIDRGE